MKSLFVNQGNGTFIDIASQIKNFANRPHADTHGASWADYDNNGTQDLLVTLGGGAPYEWYVNDGKKRTYSTNGSGMTTNNGGRMSAWLDFNNDKLLDAIIMEDGSDAKLFQNNGNGTFTESESAANFRCTKTQFAQLIDVNGDGRLDLLCRDDVNFPQKIYDTSTFPWTKLYDSAAPSPFFPLVQNVSDSAVADFNNDLAMDVFLLGGVQPRPSSVIQEGPYKVEAMLAGGTKGFKFVSGGPVTFTVWWNKATEGVGTNIQQIQIGAHQNNPKAATFTLNASDHSVAGMPPAPTSASQLPLMQIGYDPATHLWTLAIVTRLNASSGGGFSEGYIQTTSSTPITGLVSTGMWPTDQPAAPTLLMNRFGTYTDETQAAGLNIPIECSSVTAGDFDNDMYVDLYLTCRTGASNLPNILYHNNGNGTFTAIPDAGGAAGPVGLAIGDGAGEADSVVSADYDVDGFLDLFVTNGFNLQPPYIGGPNKLYHNNGNANHWIELDLVGVNSDRDATGARVYATALGVNQMRVQDGRYHRWSQDSKRIHFGLASATRVDYLTIYWPSGTVQTFTGLAANTRYKVTENSSPVVEVLSKVPPVYGH